MNANDKPLSVGQHLVIDLNVCHGQLAFKGTRLSMAALLEGLGQGKALDSILADWPGVTREAVAEALDLAAKALAGRYGANPWRDPPVPRTAGGSPADEVDLALFEENRQRFPAAYLLPYSGQHIAWSGDGTRVVASAESLEELDSKLEAMGLSFGSVVHDYVD